MCTPLLFVAGATAALGGMMLAQSSKKSPSPTAVKPPPVQQEVKEADIKAMRTGNEQVKTGVNAGTASTMLTGPQGVQDPLQLGKNTLLGQ